MIDGFTASGAMIARLQAELAAKEATVAALMEGFELPVLPIVEGLRFDVLYRPAATLERLGGDWYDVFTLRDARIAFTIGDVCGRGSPPRSKWLKQNKRLKVAASLETNNSMPRAGSSK